MATARFISWAAIGLLWVLAIWHSWTCRGLFVDGSKLLIDLVQNHWFITFRGPRLHTEVAGQILPLLGIKAGITDLHRLAQLLSLDLFGLPTLFYSLALWRARHQPVLLGAVLTAVAIVFMTTSFFIVGEYNTAYAVAVMSAVWIAMTDRLRVGGGLFLLAVAYFFSRSYEATLFLGPLLAAIAVWRTMTVPSRSRFATAIYALAGVTFLSGLVVAVVSLAEPFDPEHLETTYRNVTNFWMNLQFDLSLAPAIVIAVWAIVRPSDLMRPAPFVCASLFAVLLALSPLLVLADLPVRPMARAQYVARFSGGAVIAAVLVFMWAYVSPLGRSLPALAVLREPIVARRFVGFAGLLLVASVPADIMLTASWSHYLDTLKTVVRSHRGVVAIENTALARSPAVLLVEDWSMPSQSLAVRSKPGDGVVAPFRSYRGWSPFPPEKAPDIGPYVWRD